jgi:putative ABC transport system substrate-binding protein
MGAKWLEMLKQIAPHVTRVAVMFNPDNFGTALFSDSAVAAAQGLAIEAATAAVRSPQEIEATVAMLAREPGGGLILPPDAFTVSHRKLIVELAARSGLPAIYSRRVFVADGGLLSYGNNIVDQYRQAALYVNRILRGEKPADLPVQQPTKFELVINIKTAKALGLTIPSVLLATADEVIE